MAGWHHQLHGREFGQTPGVGDGQGGLVRCGPRGRKELDMTDSKDLLSERPQGIRHTSGDFWTMEITWQNGKRAGFAVKQILLPTV